MNTIDLESEQLDEGIKDTLSSIAGFFKKNNVEKMRTKYMRKGDSRVFASETGNGKVVVSVYQGKKKTQAKTFSNIRQADDFLNKFEEDGYKVMKRPSQIKKAATWVGTVGGSSLVAIQAVDAAIAGVFVASSVISTGGVSGIVLMGVGVSLAINIVVGAAGWVLVKASNKSRSEIRDEQDAIRIDESAPPSDAAEKWIKDNKERFKKQYGDDWEQVIYGTAWRMYKNGDF